MSNFDEECTPLGCTKLFCKCNDYSNSEGDLVFLFGCEQEKQPTQQPVKYSDHSTQNAQQPFQCSDHYQTQYANAPQPVQYSGLSTQYANALQPVQSNRLQFQYFNAQPQNANSQQPVQYLTQYYAQQPVQSSGHQHSLQYYQQLAQNTTIYLSNAYAPILYSFPTQLHKTHDEIPQYNDLVEISVSPKAITYNYNIKNEKEFHFKVSSPLKYIKAIKTFLPLPMINTDKGMKKGTVNDFDIKFYKQDTNSRDDLIMINPNDRHQIQLIKAINENQKKNFIYFLIGDTLIEIWQIYINKSIVRLSNTKNSHSHGSLHPILHCLSEQLSR